MKSELPKAGNANTFSHLLEYGGRKNTHKKCDDCSQFVPKYSEECPMCHPPKMFDWRNK